MSFNIPRLAEITVDDLKALGTGAGILGTGGGGDPRIGRLRLQMLFEDEAYPDSVTLVSPEDLPADATVTSVGSVGAPTISVEKFSKGDEDLESLRAIESFSGKTVDAIIPGEIGGANGMVPLCVAAMADLPVVDGDGMGRAFPELQMDTFFIYGSPVNYAATTDERGNQVVYKDIDSAKGLEDFARVITVQMGGRSGYAGPLMTGEFISQYAVPHTISLATALGRTIEQARDQGTDPVDASRELLGGKELFTGKVVDVHRRNRDGFALGSVTLSGLDEESSLEVEFQNEFLIARTDDDQVLTTVPDLICMVDNDTGAPVTTDSLRYGQRVRVLGVPAPELLTTPDALNVIGPNAFGYELTYKPLPRGETGW